MRTIRQQLQRSFSWLTFISLVVLNAFVLTTTYEMTLHNMEQHLRDQANVGARSFATFAQQQWTAEEARRAIELMAPLSAAHIEIWNKQGRLMAESEAVTATVTTPNDIKQALHGTEQVTMKDGNLAVAVPVTMKGQQLAVIRLTTTLQPFWRFFIGYAAMVISFSVLMLSAIMLFSRRLAKNLSAPLEQLVVTTETLPRETTITWPTATTVEMAQLVASLQQMKQQLVATEREKQTFIAAVSHELRTPLTSLRGWAQTLQLNVTEAERALGLHVLAEESERLSLLVDDLHDYTKLSLAELTYEYEYFSANQLVAEVELLFRETMRRKQLMFHVKQTEETMVYGDRLRLKQVLVNLVHNAYKFTSEGGKITLEVGDNTMTIRDTGSGMADSDIALFKRGTTKQSGSGIGLALCEQIIKAHGGVLVVESVINEGTCVTIKMTKD